MAKNRNKKNKAKHGGAAAAAMDTSDDSPAPAAAADVPQPMDVSEAKQTMATSAALSSINRKIKKGVQIKRSQNARKLKAIARAITNNEKSEEKVLKAKNKKSRVQSAKFL